MSNHCPKCGKEVETFPNGSYFCIDDDCHYYGDKNDDKIKELQSQLEKAEEALRSCKWFLHNGEPQYQFSVELVEGYFKEKS